MTDQRFCRSIRQRLLAAAGLLFLSGGAAQATVSEYTEFFIPYERAQNEEICLSRQIMDAEFGIPLASMMTGIFAPTKTLQQRSSTANAWTNINLLAQGAGIPWKLNFDRYIQASSIYDYSFTLDMGPLAAENGSSVSGRQKTRNAAKLAIIAVIKTAELMHGPGKFRVWLRFDHLPTQSGLRSVAVYAGGADWPSWPYTSSSPLVRTYLTEMLGRSCR